jgi:hypothetical protein
VPRIPRRHLVEENSTNHCTWRSHGFGLVLDSDAAREEFLALLRKYKEKFGIQILSYCLMGTHPHVMSHDPTELDEPISVVIYEGDGTANARASCGCC